MTNEQILFDEFDLMRKEIVQKYDALGMRASGQFADELKVEVGGDGLTGLTARITSIHYVDYLVEGREPGKFPPINVIEQWIEDKGIINQIEGEISVSSLAFLIARKISREGTEYFKQGGTDLIDSVVTPERIQSIIDKVTVFQISEFTARFTKLFQDLAA